GMGAAALVLEPLAAARARGASPLAVVVGHGAAGGAPDRVSADALVRAAREAMLEAGAPPADPFGVAVPAGGPREGHRPAPPAPRDREERVARAGMREHQADVAQDRREVDGMAHEPVGPAGADLPHCGEEAEAAAERHAGPRGEVDGPDEEDRPHDGRSGGRG